MSSSPPITLDTPRITVVLGEEDDESTWEQHTIRALNPDLIAWDESAARNRWVKSEDNAWGWLTFLAWRVMRRRGLIPKDMTLNAFRDRTLQVMPYKDPEAPKGPAEEEDEDSDDVARPTPPGPELG